MSNHHRSPDCTPPVVADPLRPSEEHGTRDRALESFKVLLKRNMRPQQPPADLLDQIRARIQALPRE